MVGEGEVHNKVEMEVAETRFHGHTLQDVVPVDRGLLLKVHSIAEFEIYNIIRDHPPNKKNLWSPWKP